MMKDKAINGSGKSEFCAAMDEVTHCSEAFGFCLEMHQKHGWSVRKAVEAWNTRGIDRDEARRILSDALGEDLDSVTKRVRGDK